MTNALTQLANLVFAWLFISLILSWLFAVSYPLFRRLFNFHSIYQRNAATFIYSVTPYITASLILVLLNSSNILNQLVAGHCHGNICGPHDLHFDTSPVQGFTMLGLFLSVVVIVLFIAGRQLLISRRYITALKHLSEAQQTDYRLIKSEQMAAWCAGFWHTEVYVTKPLVNTLTKQQLAIVLAHEFCHASRRDNLRKWLLHYFTAVWPTTFKQQIRQYYGNDSEIICDLAALNIAQSSTALAEVTAIMSQHCDDHAHTQKSQQACSPRQQALAQQLSHPTPTAKLISLFSYTVTLSIWLGVLLLSIHLSHPFIEWLAQLI